MKIAIKSVSYDLLPRNRVARELPKHISVDVIIDEPTNNILGYADIKPQVDAHVLRTVALPEIFADFSVDCQERSYDDIGSTIHLLISLRCCYYYTKISEFDESKPFVIKEKANG